MIGDEAREQILAAEGRLPEAVIACVGGGSNAIGAFYAFIADEEVRLVGVEAAGAASLGSGRTAVLHGARSSVLADEDGQIADAHSISAGLDYPGVGPEHAALRDSGRATYVACTDEEALAALHRLAETEGIIPALESSHALARSLDLDAELDRRVPLGPRRQGSCRSDRPLVTKLVIYLVCEPETPELAEAAVAGGADIIELGIPFSDPLAEGPTIQRASERALARGMRTGGVPRVHRCDAGAGRGAARPDDLRGDPRGLRVRPLRRAIRARPARRARSSSISRSRTTPSVPRVQLVAPTSTDERIALCAAKTDGWLYLVSLTGTTGARETRLPRARRPRRAHPTP